MSVTFPCFGTGSDSSSNRGSGLSFKKKYRTLVVGELTDSKRFRKIEINNNLYGIRIEENRKVRKTIISDFCMLTGFNFNGLILYGHQD